MIKLIRLTAKNIMSVGNSPIEVDLDTYKTTMITGKNGTGKSTILIEALTYALFGKPYRKITMPQIVNSFNKKGMVVTLDFEVGSIKYHIKRGIGPKIFEIYKDGELIKEDASIGDYQDYLETSILSISYKTFKQIVVLGTAGFTPFMQLTTPQRREVVEDLLNIHLLSLMSAMNKERIGVVQSDIQQAEHNIELMTQKLSLLSRQQSENSNQVAEQLAEKTAMLAKLEIDLENARKSLVTNETMLAKLTQALSDGAYQNELPKLYSVRGSVEGKISNNSKMMQFLKINQNCPVCTQHIDDDFKNKKVFSLDMDNDSLGLELTEHINLITSKERDRDRDSQIKTKIHDLVVKKGVDTSSISKYENDIQNIKQSIDKLNNTKFTDLSQQISKLEAMLLKVSEHRLDLMNDKYCHSVITAILKDSGVKSVIINQYIPVINKLINDYLGKMGAVYTFELDSEFNESVKTRGMENYTYNSFSQGQKYRIDLAILFAWRDLVKMISGGSFNVLVLDEVMDSSADQDGIDALVDILGHIKDRVFIISHNEKMDSMDFDRRVDVKLNGRFSEIEITV